MTMNPFEVAKRIKDMRDDDAAVRLKAAEAVKITRADAVKMVADQMIADAAEEVDATFVAMNEARDAFRACCASLARETFRGELDALARVVGTDARLLSARVLYQIHENGEDSGDVAEVVFSDTEKSYDARLRLVVRVPLVGSTAERKASWLTAMGHYVAARDRDIRVGQMKKEARKNRIKSVLDSSDEGRDLVAAIKALAASLRKA